jgi:hypothetical protein
MPATGRSPYPSYDTVPYGLPTGRFDPPAGLSEPERRAFSDLMAGCRAGHFEASDLPLMVAWCQTVVLMQDAAAALRTEAAAGGGKVSSWFTVHRDCVKTLATLAVRLRIGPQGRNPMARISQKQRAPLSYYQRQALEGIRDDPTGP